jgi:hypothetical protein
MRIYALLLKRFVGDFMAKLLAFSMCGLPEFSTPL